MIRDMAVGPRVCLLLCVSLLATAVMMPTGEVWLLMVLWTGRYILGALLWCCGRSDAEFAAARKPRRRERAILLTTTFMLLFRIPFFAGFIVSVGPLGRVGNHLYAEVPFGVPDPGPCTIGIYPLSDIHIGCGGVWFHLRFGPTLVYSPPPNHPRDCATGAQGIVRHLFGPWYVRKMMFDW